VQEVGACLSRFPVFSSSVISLVLLIFFHSFLVHFHLFFSVITSFFRRFKFVILFESCVIYPSLFPLYIFHSLHLPFIYYFRLTLSFLPALGVISLLRCCEPTARTKTRFAKRSSAHHLSPIYRQFIIQWHLLGGA